MSDLYDHLQQCIAELENAESMGNVARVKQCKAWVAQAQAEYDQEVSESVVTPHEHPKQPARARKKAYR